MSHTTRAPFDTAATFVVACAELRYAGKRYARGVVFPWRDLGVSQDDIGKLWLALKVDCAALAPVVVAVVVAAATAPAKPFKRR